MAEVKKTRADVETSSNGNVVCWDVNNIGKIYCDVAKLTPEIRLTALIWGVTEKGTNAAAFSKKDANGNERVITNRMRFDAIKETIDRLIAGEWNKKREAIDPAILVQQAMEYLYPKKEAGEITKWIAGQTKEAVANLAKSTKIQEALAKIKAAANPDAQKAAEDLLATFK